MKILKLFQIGEPSEDGLTKAGREECNYAGASERRVNGDKVTIQVYAAEMLRSSESADHFVRGYGAEPYSYVTDPRLASRFSREEVAAADRAWRRVPSAMFEPQTARFAFEAAPQACLRHALSIAEFIDEKLSDADDNTAIYAFTSTPGIEAYVHFASLGQVSMWWDIPYGRSIPITQDPGDSNIATMVADTPLRTFRITLPSAEQIRAYAEKK